MNDPDTLHLYAYCKNNPINYVDPSGHSVVSIGIKTEVAILLGAYSYVSYNTDNKSLSVCFSKGVKVASNITGSVSLFLTCYSHKSLSGLTGMGASCGISFCAGLTKISASVGLDVGAKGLLTGHAGISYGHGYAVLKIPYYEVEVGYTVQRFICKLGKVPRKKKLYAVGNQKFSMKRKKKCVVVKRKNRKICIYKKKVRIK